MRKWAIVCGMALILGNEVVSMISLTGLAIIAVIWLFKVMAEGGF